MKKTPLSRGTSQLKRTPFKRSYKLGRAVLARKKVTKLPKVAKTPLKKLKIQLWQLCRELTKKNHGTDCYTCAALNLVGANLHTGHFIPSSVCSAALRYYPDNLRPQCYRCNIHLSGNWPAFESHLIRDGIDIEALKHLNQATKGQKYDTGWYVRMITEYTQMLSI